MAMLAPTAAPGRPLDGLALGPLRAAEGGPPRRELAGVPLRAARGRWLCVRLAAPAQPVLLVAGQVPRWPDTAVPAAPAGDGSWLAWVYVGAQVRALLLDGPAAQLEPARCLGAEVFDTLPAAADAAPAMRTAAQLERLGVRELREVAFEPDAQWPLRATGADPQLRFERLAGGTRWQLVFTLAVDAAGAAGTAPPAPVVYWAGAGGFTADATVRCTPLSPPAPPTPGARAPGPTEYHATLPSGTRWRLDPLAAPGRFRLDALACTRAEPAPAMRWLAGPLQWLRDQRPWRGPADLRPAHQLRPLGDDPREGEGRWLATGDDPQWQLPGRLPAGWYMLELELALPAARARAVAYLDSGIGGPAAHSLLLRDGQLAKRLLWLPRPAALRLDPVAAPGEIGLRHFRLQRVSAAFAASRMRSKLAAARAAAISTDAGASTYALWRAYCALFEPRHEGSLSYAEWIAAVEQPALPSAAAQAARAAAWPQRPLVSILLPVFDPPPALLAECIASVQAQTWPHWQLCIADDASTDPRVAELLAQAAAQDARIRVTRRARNGHIAEASNSALALAEGEFVALLDHDDTLAPHALFSVVEALQARPGAQIVYSDEDKLDEHGARCDPFFKPDWSPDLLRAQNYVSHLGTYRRALVLAAGGFRPGFEGSQDYDLLLRCVERVADAADIVHVPRVLYHWRKTATSTAAAHEQKPYATEAARRALQERADAAGRGVQVSVVAPGLYRDRWPIPDPAPLVTLIVPTRDGLDVLRPCIESVLHRTTYRRYEILVVDNRSEEPATLEWLAALAQRHPGTVRVLAHDAPFNFAAINNAAVAQARGEIVGLLNNDVEVLSPDWLTEMVSHAVRPDVGCVGAKLYYPDDTVQHAGVVLGIGGVAGHSHKYFPRDSEGYFSRLRTVHEVSAVTAAVMVLRKAVWLQAGGMDAERLHVAFNDVDFCLKVRALGLRNLFTPWAELVHHESKTRGTDADAAQRERFEREVRTMRSRWGRVLDGDPYYNPNLTLVREDYSLGTHRASGAPT
jgi:glycosyltransferase involved in cell wall biosynthesis